jgi:hypothetical protein
MKYDAAWAARLKGALFAVLLIAGAAGGGGWVSDWLERGHSTRVVTQQRLGPTASRSIADALRRSEIAVAAETLPPRRAPIMD